MARRKKGYYRARDLARQRIERLFLLAEEEHTLHPERSDRYVAIARKMGMRMRVRIPRRLKRRICKGCRCYLSPDRMRVRLRDGVITVTCTECGEQMSYPYRRKL
ncbi:MAG: ribonuclease P [Methanothrix sp.]|uniref:Ribonuclease P protein component 4 n=1 Tax=Methanothrix harundinacea TaxID=301375 RepID=A0A101IM58_9EURY|nr:MAG: Ribonuclease P protein component 4 [Methanothrix harundinacea]KUK97763.1 MAG: Ribonuclease P protein component 4 [Methanothrix harundinacea]MDD3710514.1 ribonuclease P [Methanothrix sp.]MDD5767047.1 ribonuclease P [Methanothrix sp.]MDI9399842.1 ribonuclease P [Euryarchaeota archaeon]